MFRPTSNLWADPWTRSWANPWLIGLAALTLLRLAVAATLPLSPDESYYWIWSRALAPGYLDHPPMVAAWIWLGTALAGQTALGVRLLAPFAALVGSLLLARAAEALFPGRGAGLPAAALLNATLLLGVGSVTMTPDTPLILFWTAAVWAVASAHRTGQGWWWLLAGGFAGGALLSKYTAALLGVGFGLWLLLVPAVRRTWLRTPWPWAGGLVAVALFAPVVAWNAAHGWASFAKQGGRVGDWQPLRAAQFLGELLVGQVGLATPVVLAVCAAGAWTALRRCRSGDPGWALSAATTWPGVLVFAQHALGDRVQANWLAVLYPGAAIAAGAAGVRYWKLAALSGLVLTGAAYAQATLAVLPLPRPADPALIRLAGWDRLTAETDAARRSTGAAWIAAEEYGLASELAWHAGAAGTPVIGAEPRRWSLFDLPAPGDALPVEPGIVIQSTRRREPPDPALWTDVEPLGELLRGRDGVEAERYRLYRARLRGRGGATLLPRRQG